MKNLIAATANAILILGVLTVMSSQSVSAQSPTKMENIVYSANDDQMHITKFSVHTVEQKSFLKWSVKGEPEDIIYVIERSINGNDFESIGIKKGYASPKDFQILYCFIDENPSVLPCSYRIKQIHSDGTVQLSNVENSNNPDGQTLFGALKN